MGHRWWAHVRRTPIAPVPCSVWPQPGAWGLELAPVPTLAHGHAVDLRHGAGCTHWLGLGIKPDLRRFPSRCAPSSKSLSSNVTMRKLIFGERKLAVLTLWLETRTRRAAEHRDSSTTTTTTPTTTTMRATTRRGMNV